LQGSEFKRFLSVLWPGIVGALIMGVMPLIDKSMASHMAAGTVACLTFASRPISMVARFGLYSLITALLPTFASLANEEGGERFRETVSQMLRILVFVTAPVGILLAALRVPIIEVLFERGSFDAESTELTSQIFAALAFGLCPMALAIATSTVFASMQDTKTGAFIGGGSSLIAKVVFNLLLIAPLGAVGLAWSTSLQYVVSGILLLTCLKYRLEGLRMRDLISVTARVLAASAFAFFYVQWLLSVLDLPPLFLCVVGMISGSCVYLAFAGILRIEELHQIYYQFAESPALRRHLPTRIQRMLP
jgi:putative peptidoglycan lipid II flippase